MSFKKQINFMDYTNPNLDQPPIHSHNKARWIIIFIACLIVIVSLTVVLKKQMKVTPEVRELTKEEMIIKATSATGSGGVSEVEMKKILNSTTAKTSKTVSSEAEKKKIIDATSVK
jgi:hypothetical protein